MPDLLLIAGLAYLVAGFVLALASVIKDPPGDSVTLPEAVVGFVLLVFILPVACVLLSIDGRRP